MAAATYGYGSEPELFQARKAGVQPDVIQPERHYQLGTEAVMPVDCLSCHATGGILQLHFHLDNLFLSGVGKSIFGR